MATDMQKPGLRKFTRNIKHFSKRNYQVPDTFPLYVWIFFSSNF